jgi:hypothetical protein
MGLFVLTFLKHQLHNCMGEVEVLRNRSQIYIHSNIICYGNAADEILTRQLQEEIETMWNEPVTEVYLEGVPYTIRFIIGAEFKKDISELEILQNTNPRNNYFRIEAFAKDNISFVDAIGCNTGYFKLENLYRGSTTAAHEFGHTLGLAHPHDLDIRGKGQPGIMYPRGTLVDPQFQYDPTIPAGTTGGTLHPMYRKVLPADIKNLKLHRLAFSNNRAVLGAFTNIFHWDHASIDDMDFE